MSEPLARYSRTDVIHKLESQNFFVNQKGEVFSRSQTSGKRKKRGQINDNGVFFFSSNVYPYKEGQAHWNDIFGSEVKFIPPPQEPRKKTTEANFSFENYLDATKTRNQFSTFLKALFKDEADILSKSNIYDVRGVKSGYLEDATLFPYIDYNDNFKTAKIIGYNTVTGKRIQGKENWFHTYKPIKAELNSTETLTKGNCFFGEQLVKGNNKPIVIVEAEKTAVILSKLFPNIVFLSSGGLTNLRPLEWSFLQGRKVFLFPDNGANEWFDIATERSWFCSNIIETFGTHNEDYVDYLLNPSGSRVDVLTKLNDELFRISNGIDIDFEKGLLFAFAEKKKTRISYCLPIPNELGLTHYQDYSKGESFKGKNFRLWREKFVVLNANINFNASVKEKGSFRLMNVDEYLAKLKKCYLILKHLNPKANLIKPFTKVLHRLNIESNHTFNVDFVLRVFIPQWEKEGSETLANEIAVMLSDAGTAVKPKLIKIRNWRFESKNTISDIAEFNQKKNDDEAFFRTNETLKLLLPMLSENEFIEPEKVGLSCAKSNVFLWTIIEDFNQNILGCKTLRNYKEKMYLNGWLLEYLQSQKHFKCNTFLDSPYYSNTNMDCPKKCCTLPSKRALIINTGVHQKMIDEYFSFKPKRGLLKKMISEVEYRLDNPLSFEVERKNSRLQLIPQEREAEKKDIFKTCKEAFDYPLDLSNSVLNVPFDEYYRNYCTVWDWVLFHNPHLTEKEREEVKRGNYHQYLPDEWKHLNIIYAK
jgi:hypothetical protein